MTNRLARVRELILRELASIILRDYTFPNVLVTVNDVDITPDLKQAFVFVGILGPDHRAESIIEHLNRHRGEIQQKLSRRVILRNTAKLEFRLDTSVARGVRITNLMETIDRQLADAAERDAAEAAAAPTTADPGPE
jgi:ribosome-binding factor A